MPQQSQQGFQQQMHQDVNRRQTKDSIGSSTDGPGDYSDGSADNKPHNKAGRPKKVGSGGKVTNGKRKAEDTPSKALIKKQRGSNGMIMPEDDPDDMDEPTMDDMDMDEHNADGKKMTDEEKRKNFLERNRYVEAALEIFHLAC